jgi:hypothetical protein
LSFNAYVLEEILKILAKAGDFNPPKNGTIKQLMMV